MVAALAATVAFAVAAAEGATAGPSSVEQSANARMIGIGRNRVPMVPKREIETRRVCVGLFDLMKDSMMIPFENS
jgi:hypothetical protein